MSDQNPDRDDSWETAMSNEFERRVRDLHAAPLTLDQVRGTATSIRRKRRATIAGGVLAVAAVIAPIAVLAFNGNDQTRTIQPADPTQTVATETADPTPTPEPTQAAPSAANPLGIDYLDGARLIRADGSSIDLPRAYTVGTSLGEDLFLGGLFSSPNTEDASITVDLVDAQGSVVDSEPAISLPVSNDDHTVGAYLDTDGALRLRGASDEATIPVAFKDGDKPVTVVGDADCIAQESCLVYVTSGAENSTQVVSQDGRADVLTNGIQTLDDAQSDDQSDDLSVGLTSFSGDGSCSAVVAGPTQEQRFENCDFGYRYFSPGLDYLSGEPNNVDGFGPAWAGIYSSQDGTEIARFQPKNGGITDAVWQDDDDLLVNVFNFVDQSWRIVRLNVDGTQTTVLGPTPGADFEPPYVLVGGQ